MLVVAAVLDMTEILEPVALAVAVTEPGIRALELMQLVLLEPQIQAAVVVAVVPILPVMSVLQAALAVPVS